MLIQQFDNTKNVLEATRERIAFIFDRFDTILISISGGKDSTTLAHLAMLEAHRRDRKIGLFFLDEEVVYQSSADQVEYLLSLFPENVNRLWLQFEFLLSNSVSLKNGQLLCWEKNKHRYWMRQRGQKNILAKPWDKKTETIRNKKKGAIVGFYDVIENFERMYTNAAFLVGLRAAGESPNRWRAVVKNPIDVDGQQIFWGTKKGQNFTLYPIYDWNYYDVWRYLAENNVKYSKIYDFQFKKGFAINEMRVSSLLHERSFKSVCELPEFEPKTYEKLLKRIDGIAFAQETGKNSKMFRVRKLPKNFKSWCTYRDFLLDTYPHEGRKTIFRQRFAKQLDNEFVARQQCRQLILNDYENNLPIENKPDPRDALIAYYKEVL